MSKPESQPRPDTIYGINAVKEAIGSRPVEYVLVAQGQSSRRVQEIIESCRKATIAVRFAPRPALDREVGNARHQDVVAVCSAKAYDDLDSLIAFREHPLLVVLDGVEDPGNLGAIVRPAVAAGAGRRGWVPPHPRAP